MVSLSERLDSAAGTPGISLRRRSGRVQLQVTWADDFFNTNTVDIELVDSGDGLLEERLRRIAELQGKSPNEAGDIGARMCHCITKLD